MSYSRENSLVFAKETFLLEIYEHSEANKRDFLKFMSLTTL